MSRISDESSEFLGFNHTWGRPEWMVIQNLIVVPPQVRPSVEMGSGGWAEDDLTTMYIQIIKTNNYLRSSNTTSSAEHTIREHWDLLQFFCSALVNNDISG